MTRIKWAPQVIEDVEAIRAYVARDSAHYADLLVDSVDRLKRPLNLRVQAPDEKPASTVRPADGT